MLSEKAKKCKNSRIFKIGSALLSIKKSENTPKLGQNHSFEPFVHFQLTFFHSILVDIPSQRYITKHNLKFKSLKNL